MSAKKKLFAYSAIVILVLLGCNEATEKIEIIKKNEILKNSERRSFTRNIPLRETDKIIKNISSDKFEGRKPGTRGFHNVTKYIVNYLKSNDIKPFYRNNYLDVVTNEWYPSANIVGLIGNYDRRKEHIILGAHLDHLGKKRWGYGDRIYNGADDNASGVTAVLNIAKELSSRNYNKNIILILFTEEETGLIGSSHIAKRLKNENVNVSYMINFEMIGTPMQTGKNKVYLTGFKKSNMAKEMNTAAGRNFVEFLPIAKHYRLFNRSDNYPFYRKFNVPCHSISTFDFPRYGNHYHKVSDEYRNLDVSHMNSTINTMVKIIDRMLLNDIKLKMKENFDVTHEKASSEKLESMCALMHEHYTSKTK